MINRVKHFKRVITWIKKHTIDGNGICVTSKEHVIYPEVTGYYIPTLLQWGERELAVSYAKYLCSIQKPDGSWYDAYDNAPYVFDSAQILKGLIAIRDIMPEVDDHIIRGCDWIISNMQSDGRLTTPSKDAWGDDEGFCSELIHIYCLSPLIEAGNVFNRQEYKDSAKKILEYYKREKMDRIMNFSLLSHFYAYVMEGLFDLGETKLCREAMEKLEKAYSNKDAVVPGLKDVPWICSTGLFQLSLVWYKLGELERGNRLFYYVLDLQNESGGWYGSYPEKGFFARFHRGRNKPFYFQDAEISWAVKYFLDALSLKEKLEFEKQSSSFLDVIDEDDGRYILVKRLIQEVESKAGGSVSVCDAGCGKGRYLKRLTYDLPDIDYYAFDISEKVMSELENIKEKRVGSLTKILYEDGCFDLVYVCEAFEHAINTRSAFRELLRIVKPGGILVIIDKPVEKLGQLDIYEWEQWISDADISTYTEECGGTLEIVKSVPYEGKDDGLFRAWIITKNK